MLFNGLANKRCAEKPSDGRPIPLLAPRPIRHALFHHEWDFLGKKRKRGHISQEDEAVAPSTSGQLCLLKGRAVARGSSNRTNDLSHQAQPSARGTGPGALPPATSLQLHVSSAARGWLTMLLRLL